MKLPEGQQVATPYFIIHKAEEFATFLEQVFNAKRASWHTDGEGKLMHSEYNLDGSMIMFGQASAEWQPVTGSIFLYVPDADASYALALKHGSETVMPLENKEYGRTCGIKDPFGIIWWITTPL